MRNIAGKKFLSHSDPIFKNLNILKFHDLLQYNQSTFMYKLLNDKQPDSFDNFFKRAPNFESDTNRRAFCYSVDKLKNDSVGRFPTATLPRTWNSIDMGRKMISTLKSFKKSVSFDIIDSYVEIIKCHNGFCPDCN